MKHDVPDKTNWRNFQHVCFDPSSSSAGAATAAASSLLLDAAAAATTTNRSSSTIKINGGGSSGDEPAKRRGTAPGSRSMPSSTMADAGSNSNNNSKHAVACSPNSKNNEGVLTFSSYSPPPPPPTLNAAASPAVATTTTTTTATRTLKSGAYAGDGRAKKQEQNQKSQASRESTGAPRNKRGEELHPLDAASLISKLFFGWMFPFIWRGWRSGLSGADMPSEPSSAESCHKIGERLVAHWTEELESCGGINWRATGAVGNDSGGIEHHHKHHQPALNRQQPPSSKGRAPSLARAVISAHAKWMLLNSLLAFFAEVVCKSLSAYSVGQMLLHMSTKRELVDYSRIWSLEEPLVFWSLSLVASVCLWVLTAHFYGFQMMRVGLHVRVGCSYLIYRKSLKLGQQHSGGSSQTTTMGKMINLLSNDLDKFNYVCIMVPFLWVGPIQTVVSLYLLWPILGRACFGALLVLACLTPIQFYLSRKFASFRRRIAACTDERVHLLNETITALKLIKLYAWEYFFRRAMLESRRRETDLINRVAIIKGISVALMYVSSKLVLFVTIIFHCLLFGGSLDARTLFMAMALLNNVQFTMTQLMPRVVSLGVESLVSLKRITDFLLMEEFSPSERLRLEPLHKEVVRSKSSSSSSLSSSLTTADVNRLMPRQIDLNKRTAFVEFQNVGACWSAAGEQTTKTTMTISGVSFRCESPGLIVICGQVASGKSSLLMSLLNELPISQGRAQVHGSIGYSSQNAWIFNGTVRDNIIFGFGYNEQRYKRVLEMCALKRDLDLLEHGDFTYIQENSLSGGQKARVNLARCLYRDCDIYLLDDPFSAIDGRVADHIFEEALRKFLANKLVLLVTHRVGLIKECDKVLLLDQGSQLSFCEFGKLQAKLHRKEPGKHFTREQLERLSFLVRDFDDPSSSSAANEGDKTDTAGVESGGALNLGSENGERKREFLRTAELKTLTDSIEAAGSEQKKCSSRAANNSASGGNEASKNSLTVVGSSQQRVCAYGKFAGTETTNRQPKSNQLLVSSKETCDGEDEKDQTPILIGRQTTLEQKQQEQRDTQAKACIRAGKDKNCGKDEATKCPVHAPYGLSSSSDAVKVASDEDKTLITIQGANHCSNRRMSAVQAASGDHRDRQSTTIISGCDGGGGGHGYDPTESEAAEGGTDTGRKQNEEQEARSQLTTTNKVNSLDGGNGRRTMDMDEAHYRTARCERPNEQEEEETAEKGKGSSKSKYSGCSAAAGQKAEGGNFRSRSGPTDEATSSRRLPGLSVWYKYYTQTSVIRLVLIILTFLITQALFSTVDIYLTVWSLVEQNKALVNEITGFNQQQLTTFVKHQASMNQHGAGNRTGSNIIQYDLMIGSGGDSAPMMSSSSSLLLLLLSLAKYNCTDSLIEIGRELQKARISPLSSRSSQLPFVAPMSNFFVPMVDLFYTASSAPITPTQTTTPTAAAAAAIYYYPTATNTSQQQQLQQMKSHSELQQQKHRNQITDDFTETTALLAPDDYVMVDRNIVEESEAALNVKSIYRPLYLLVNNFTSGHHALTYTLLLVALFSCSAIANVLSLTSSNKSAISLYKKLTDNALFARMVFFDRNPVGRFLNRATRDIGIIDEAIPYNANQAYDALLQTAATFIVVGAVDMKLALPSLIILFIFLIFHSIHVKPTKDIQRLEGVSRSPIISHISTTLAGLHTIRATKSEHRFERLFTIHQDAHTSIFLLYLGCNRSMAVVLDSLNASYTGIIAFWAVVSGLSGPSAGLIITSAMLLSGLTQHGVMKLTETESLMTSVERVIEYCSLPQEENYDRRRGIGLPAAKGQRHRQPSLSYAPPKSTRGVGSATTSWLSKGCVEYRQVDLYYNRLEKPVLKNISFKLNAGEKVGIVGRTGAGKSSIITTLFRLYDFEGTILIDGVDIKALDLIELRTAIGIIPQNPILFPATIRENLDPLNVHDDFSLWAALDKAHLRETVSALPGKLDYNIGSGGGGGFSSGQKQLMCLARVLLRQSPLIVMDEATANVDPSTDAIIQTTIRREFKHCTVITIAHRLETILDCDRIMVLEAGRIVDFATPEQLVAKSNSYFSSLAPKSSSKSRRE